MKKKHFNIPIFIPEAACPFQCIYCNQRKITGHSCHPEDSEIKRIIRERLKTIPPGSEIQIAFFGGNFTGFPLEEQKHYLELVQPYIQQDGISGIRISTRPDYITGEVLALLKSYRVTSIELGAQSLDNGVLKASRRGHTAADTERASRLIRDMGFMLGLQMMIGLPGDTFDKSVNTAHRIIELGAAETRIYPTLVIRDTLLEKLFREGKYQPLPLEEAVRWSAELVKIFDAGKVTILKLGLHPSEGLLSGEDLIAGPWHPSFRELVMTEIWRELLLPLLNMPGDSLVIEVPAGQVNYAVGYKGKNRNMLLKRFREVKFTAKFTFKGRNFEVI